MLNLYCSYVYLKFCLHCLANKTTTTTTTTKHVQYFDETSMLSFANKVQNVTWPLSNADNDVNAIFDSFNSTLENIYNSSFPVQTKKQKLYYNKYKPWITGGILKSIRHKNKLYKRLLTYKTPVAKSCYIKYKNRLTNTIRNSEKIYYANCFKLASGNMRDTWRLINSILHDTCGLGGRTTIKEIIHNNKTISAPREIANKFNDFFSNIGTELAKQIPNVEPNVTIIDSMPPRNCNSLFLMPCTGAEIIDIVNKLNNSKSTGLDGYKTNVIKYIIDQLATPLANIFNISLQTGIFPEKLKQAKVTPIHKADDKRLINNYRPISVLPLFSKVLEKLMYSRLITFIEKHKILTDNQYGFREKHSTYMALINMVDQISDEMDKKKFSIGIFLDLSKAFDTIDHQILLQKLEIYGVRGITLKWFTSYLTNRKQCVSVNNEYSTNAIITCGVPQGSILGPLLFLLYINDLVNCSKLLKFIMFADDTNLFYSHKNLNDLVDIVNQELIRVSLWLKVNKLSLNIKKTHFIIFHFKQKKITSPVLIHIDDNILEQVKTTKFLGVIINENLTWSDHVEVITNKCSKNLGIIRKISRSVPNEILLTLYNTLIYPYLNYCNIVWSSQPTTVLHKLFRLQKKAVRIMTYSHWNAHTLPLFHRLKLLTVYDINKLQTSCFTYSAIHFLLPSAFAHYFLLNSLIHEHNTRASSNLHSLSRSTNLRSYSTRINAPTIWNTLPSDLKYAPSLPIFKSKYKNLLLNSYH